MSKPKPVAIALIVLAVGLICLLVWYFAFRKSGSSPSPKPIVIKTLIKDISSNQSLDGFITALNSAAGNGNTSRVTNTKSGFTPGKTSILDLPEFSGIDPTLRDSYDKYIVPIIQAFLSKLVPMTDGSLKKLYYSSRSGPSALDTVTPHSTSKLASLFPTATGSPIIPMSPAGPDESLITIGEFASLDLSYRVPYIQSMKTFIESQKSTGGKLTAGSQAILDTYSKYIVSKIDSNLQQLDFNNIVIGIDLTGKPDITQTKVAPGDYTLINFSEFDLLDGTWKSLIKQNVLDPIKEWLKLEPGLSPQEQYNIYSKMNNNPIMASFPDFNAFISKLPSDPSKVVIPR